jgi:DNA-binding transcriptional regulator YdaS (Cro superfamily)
MYELQSMKIATFRKDVLDVSQEEFARLVGLRSKSRVSDIERENRCSPRVALAIERLSNGAISAAEISPAVALVREQAA